MENFETFKLDQTGQQTQEILDQVSTNTADIAQLRALYEALTQSEPIIIQPSDTWPVADPQENVIYRVIDRVNTPPQSYSDYMWNGTAMVLMATYNNSIDNEPTPGSNNLVKSGGVAASIVFDISAYHATGSTLATYADLASALGSDGANVPASVRKGGMSVKFVRSNDNTYVQYRLMSDSFNTTVANWQGVDDEPAAGSNNLVESGGIIFYPTLDYGYNKIVGEIALIGCDITPDLVLYRDSNDLYAQFYDGSTLIGNVSFYNGCESGEIRKASINSQSFVGEIYAILSDKSLISSLSNGANRRVKLSKQCHNISYSKRIGDYLNSLRYVNNFFYDKSVIKEIYVKSSASGIKCRWYVEGTYKTLQFFNSDNSVLDYFNESDLVSYSYAKGANGIVEVIFGDISSLLALGHTTKNYTITDVCKEIIQSPTLYSKSTIIKVSESNIANPIKEMYLDSNDAILYGRFYYYDGYKSLQISTTSSFTSTSVITEFVLNKTGFIEDLNKYGCIFIDNIDYSQTSAVFKLNDTVKDIFNSPNIFTYLGKTITVTKTGRHSNLIAAILQAEQYENAIVKVEDGIYDIIADMKEIYGNDYFDNYTHTDVHSGGVELKNNIKIIFTAQAKVVCNYEGDNTQVMQYFSPFIGGYKGFTLENLDISASRVRYCVHDDNGWFNSPYQNNYINCKMYLDNRQNTAWRSNSCIGGGFGKSGIINIISCEFETEDTGIAFNTPVSYHNSSVADAQSYVYLRDCYFKQDNTFRISYYGVSNKMSTAKVCGCSFGAQPFVSSEAGATNVNVELIEWNNEIRS